ncbi:tetratricopeptide repeat protein [Candidatus Saganbacteria bacterium]|nr:tetratricopeptide repeat protein [Candidatus Saganbacteria bacterium]
MKKIALFIVLLFLSAPLAKGIVAVSSQEGFLLTVTSSTTVIVEGKPCRLNVGQKLTGFSRIPVYKAVLENSREVLVPAGNVEEPLIEYIRLGYGAYMAGSYETAVDSYKRIIAIDPSFADGYLWLAESYLSLEDFENSYSSIMEAMKINERNESYKLFAQVLADKYLDTARNEFNSENYAAAVAAYQKVLDLKPDSYTSWIELGKSYEKLGLYDEAYSAWGGALNASPEAQEVYALLRNTRRFAGIVAKLKLNNEKTIPPLADDSLAVVKKGITDKGTKIETALKSLLTLTKSLGVPIIEKGWDVKEKDKNFFVSYIVEKAGRQGTGTLETFEWLVNSNTKQASAHNENARLLMNRW